MKAPVLASQQAQERVSAKVKRSGVHALLCASVIKLVSRSSFSAEASSYRDRGILHDLAR